MAKLTVTASEFIVSFKRLANAVLEQRQRVVITRHGQRLGAFVCVEDLDFLEQHKPEVRRKAGPLLC